MKKMSLSRNPYLECTMSNTRSTMKHKITVLSMIIVAAYSLVASAETKVSLNDFYRPFELSEITPKKMLTSSVS